jgi:hypothetical protein
VVIEFRRACLPSACLCFVGFSFLSSLCSYGAPPGLRSNYYYSSYSPLWQSNFFLVPRFFSPRFAHESTFYECGFSQCLHVRPKHTHPTEDGVLSHEGSMILVKELCTCRRSLVYTYMYRCGRLKVSPIRCVYKKE